MLKRLQGLVVGLLIGTIFTSGLVFAKTGTETIEAMYNNIKIYIDGIKINPTDATGKTVDPFIYNGTTYLPVRAIGEAIGKTVTWDGATQSVYLGEKPGDVQYLMDVCPPYQTNCYEAYTISNGKSFLMGGKKYTNGFTLGNNGVLFDTYAIINTDGKFNKMSFYIGHVDKTKMEDRTVKFYLDGKLIKEHKVIADALPQKITINLNYGMQLKIDDSDQSGSVGFGDIIVE